jgi:pheromone shutdown protein TraB
VDGFAVQVASAVLHERDLYMAWSLKRSKAVNGCERVVGILGRGHVPGVVYHLLQDSSNLRFRDLAGSRRRGKSKRVVPKWLVVIVGNLGLVYACQLLWDFVSQRQANLL